MVFAWRIQGHLVINAWAAIIIEKENPGFQLAIKEWGKAEDLVVIGNNGLYNMYGWNLRLLGLDIAEVRLL